MSITNPEMDSLKVRLRAMWMAGDFSQIAKHTAGAAEELVARLGLTPGERVLDVACGSGNLAIPAARAGAVVTGVDIAPNLLAQARARAAAEGLHVQFEEGDAEALLYADASFDTVMTMFGAMFAPRPELAARELLRVCRSGGRVAMGNWTPEGFVGQMFKIGSRHVPPPPGMRPPVEWGDEEIVRERLREGVTDLRMERRVCLFQYPFPPSAVVEFFRTYFGPTQRAFEALDEAGQAALRADLERHWTAHNRAAEGATEVEGEYLEVVATKG